MKNFFINLYELKIGGEPVIHVVWCVAILLFALLLRKWLASQLAKITCKIANKVSDKKHADTFISLLQRPLELLLTTILFYIAINQLTVLLDTTLFRRVNESGKVRYAIHLIDAIDKVFLLFIIVFITLVISRIADFVFHILIDKAFEEDNKEREQLFPLIKEVAKILLWTIGTFWILGSVFHVNIPALITGLGIGGVAIALAAKESVENFFASFTILTDKPFSSGDSIRLGNQEGKVEKVGFRSTRLRSADGSMFIIPNKNLIGNNLENLSQRSKRRVSIPVHIQYNVSYTQLQQIVENLKRTLKNEAILTDEEVLLEAFNEASFVLNIIYHLPDPLPQQVTLAALKHQINLKIYKELDTFFPSSIQKYELVDEKKDPDTDSNSLQE